MSFSGSVFFWFRPRLDFFVALQYTQIDLLMENLSTPIKNYKNNLIITSFIMKNFIMRFYIRYHNEYVSWLFVWNTESMYLWLI